MGSSAERSDMGGKKQQELHLFEHKKNKLKWHSKKVRSDL